MAAEAHEACLLCSQTAQARPCRASLTALHFSMPKRDGPAKKRRGQAPALPVRLWKVWLQWLLEHAGPRVFFVVFLTGALGLRCSEALALKREDIKLDADIPKVRVTGDTQGAKKSPGDVYVRKQHLSQLQKFLKEGITAEKVRRHKHGKGKGKLITTKMFFKVPTSGYIFKSREKAKAPHLHYMAVYTQVRKEAPKFYKHLKKSGEKLCEDAAKLRPHSGRATLITELMGEGMVTAMSMKYARHAPGSFKVHLGYGRLSLSDVKTACDKLDSSRKKTRWTTWTTKELLKAQKEIIAELSARAA